MSQTATRIPPLLAMTLDLGVPLEIARLRDTTFIDTYFAPQGLGADDWVTRIEWRYLDQGGEL